MKIQIEVTKRRLVAVLAVAAVGAGCYFWGLWSVDVDSAIDTFLGSEPAEMQKGRYAGYAVAVVGNETISEAWVTFCDNVVEDCKEILQNQD